MDFSVADDLQDFRAEAKRWVEKNVDPRWVVEQRVTGIHHSVELHRLLAEQGWLGAGWPAEFGGSDRDPGLARALLQEIVRTGLAIDAWVTTAMVCRTIERVGTDVQRRRIIRGCLEGRVVIALGYTEPDCGSDVAAAKTRAVSDGQTWLINGQKMFTTNAAQATHVFLLTRSAPSLPKHRGLTMFLVPMSTPGIEWRPIGTMGGTQTYATFFTEVRVGDDARIGQLNEGWSVMRVALLYERGGETPGGTSAMLPGGETLDQRVAQWAAHTVCDDGSFLLADSSIRERLARIAIDNEVARLLAMKAAWAAENGAQTGIEGSSRKLFTSEANQRAYSELLEILGGEGVLARSSAAPVEGMVEEAFRSSVVETIRGGASEVLRDIIAERRLGLPRTRPLS